MRRVSAEGLPKLFSCALCTIGSTGAWCDSFTYRPFPLLQQMRLYHPGSPVSPTHNDSGRTPTEEIPSSRFMEIFLDATRAHSLDSELPNVGSFYSRLFSPAKKGSHSVDGFPEAPVANSALHYFPNAPVASLFIIRPRADGVFEIPEEVHEEKGGGSGLRTRPFRTPLDAVKALPPLLREAAAQEAISRARRSSTRVDARGASQPSDGDVAARLHPAFIRSVLEQAFLRLYLRPLEGGEGNSRPVEAASSPSSHRVRSDGKGRAFYAHVYPLCAYDALPRALRETLERGLAAVWLSSAFSFHVAWAWLLGRGYGHLALELFMLWGWANPDSIVVEQAQRLLPTTYPTWKGGLLVEKGANRLVGLRAIALQLDSHVAGMSDSELRTAHLCGGFLTTTLMYPKGYLEALATHLGAQLPYKKYYVTCALLPQVLKAAARLSDMTFSAKPGKRSEPGVERNHRERPAWPPPRYDRGAEIFQEVMREWVLPVLCPSPRLPSLLQPQRGNLASSVEFSSEEIGYDPYTERCEEWIVLACTLAAIGLLEGYVVASRRAHAIRAVSTIRSDPSNYEDPHPRVPDEHEQVVELPPLLEATLLDILRERYLAWAWSLVSSRLSTDADSLEMLQARTRVEDWARVIFSTVFDGFHASGVFHPAPTRRPITACGVWRRLHDGLLGKFPHVFHGGSTVATLWVLMALEGMSTHLPCGPLPVSFFGKEEALIAWRRVAGFGGGWEVSTRDFHHRARNPAAEEAMEYWATSGSGYQPREERQRRMEFLLAGIATAGEEAGRGGGRPIRRGSFSGPPPSFASNRVHWVSHAAPDIFEESGAVEALREAVAAALDVFRRHAALPVLRPAPFRGGVPPPLLSSAGFTAEEELAGVAREAAYPSFYVLLKLLQVLVRWGQPSAAAPRTPLWREMLEREVVGACAPILARFVRRLGMLGSVHSGACGARALLETPVNAQAVSWDRLLQALLWSTWPADTPEKWGEEDPHDNGDDEEEKGRAATWRRETPQGPLASFGTNSLGWRVLQAWVKRLRLCPSGESAMEGPPLDLTRSNPTPSSERVAKTLKHVLSFLDTLAFHIPEGTRCAVSILPTLNNPTLWRLVADTATWQVGEAPQYASRPIDSGHDLIDHFITTLLSSSLHDGAGKAPHAVDEQVGENYPSALAEDDLGGDSPHATSQGDEGEEANPYDSGEAVWLEELDAASTSPWDENMAETANEVGSDVPSEDEVGRSIAKKTSVSQESQYSHAHATSNTDSSAMEADSIAREAEGNNEWKFDDTPETSEGVSTNQSHNSIENGNHSCHTTDSSSGDRHEIFQSTKALRMVLKQNSPAGFHLFFSFLELIGWVLHLPVPSVRWPTTADSSQLLPLFSDFRADGVISHWVTTFSLSYTALLRIFNPVPSRAFRFSPLEDENRGLTSTSPTTVARTLHDPAIMEKIILLLLNTCPDVWLMSAILHCWWTSLLHRDHCPDGAGYDKTRFAISTTHGKALEKIRRGKSNGVENGGAPRAMLMPRVEISLCVLLYHAGLNAHAVRSWRQRQLDPIEASPLSTGGPGRISDKGDRFDTRKWHAVHEAVLETVFGDVLGETGGCDNEVRGDPTPESSLLHLIGSMTLLSLETRAVSRGQSGRRREACGASDSSGKSPTAVGMPHSKNFYVAEFLVGDESRAAGSRVEAAWGRGPPVIFPSQQLASVVNGRGSSIGSSALHGRSWGYAWRYSLSPRQKMQLRRAFACRPSSPSAPGSAKPTEGRKHRGYDRDVAGSQNMRHPSSLHEIDHSSNGKLLLAEDDDEFTNLFTSLMSSPNA